MRFITIVFISFVAIITSSGQSLQLKDCYVKTEGDTITVGNTYTERKWQISDGNLHSLALKNNERNEIVLKSPEAVEPETPAPDSITIIPGIMPETYLFNEKLRVQITFHFKGYEKRATIAISPRVPAISLHYSFKRKNEEEISELNSLALDRVLLPSLHYTLKTVEFFDQTDNNNNLVIAEKCLPFTSAIKKQGNILIAKSNDRNSAFYILKESPGHEAQPNYSGYDFLIEGAEISVHGAGISQSDVTNDDWLDIYSIVTGVPVSHMDCNYSLRLYQKSIRKHIPSRDDMIMLNTWGDRNRDQSINEAFCIREIDVAARYGFTHFQIDDGWQSGLSKNSGNASGKIWDNWEKEHWKLHPERFPRGFSPVRRHAEEKSIKTGLWFHPSTGNNYENWKRDAEIIGNLYHDYHVQYFKIDGVKIPTKKAEVNFRKFLNHALDLCADSIVFNLDATADKRGGYHYFNEYGNIFLENRYTDWGKYYPHWTLRNLWQLSAYVPPEKIQIEFLNIWRNLDKYASDDPLTPSKIPFRYVFATTMAAQPLAWFEASNLPEESQDIIPIIQAYKEVWNEFHRGVILPIGNMPDGYSWTGFQSLMEDDSGYVLIFREKNPEAHSFIETCFQPGDEVTFEHITGDGEDFEATVNSHGEIDFKLPEELSFALYHYGNGN